MSITYLRFVVIGSERYIQSITRRAGEPAGLELSEEEMIMKTWMKPSVREQEVGLEVTSVSAG